MSRFEHMSYDDHAQKLMEQIKQDFLNLMASLEGLLNTRERSVTEMKLEEGFMWANQAILSDQLERSNAKHEIMRRKIASLDDLQCLADDLNEIDRRAKESRDSDEESPSASDDPTIDLCDLPADESCEIDDTMEIFSWCCPRSDKSPRYLLRADHGWYVEDLDEEVEEL